MFTKQFSNLCVRQAKIQHNGTRQLIIQAQRCNAATNATPKPRSLMAFKEISEASEAEFINQFEDQQVYDDFEQKIISIETERCISQPNVDKPVITADPLNHARPNMDSLFEIYSALEREQGNPIEVPWFFGQHSREGLSRVNARSKTAITKTMADPSPNSKVYREARLLGLTNASSEEASLLDDGINTGDRALALVWYLDAILRKKYTNPDLSPQHTRALRIFSQEYRALEQVLNEEASGSSSIEQVTQKFVNKLKEDKIVEKLVQVQKEYTNFAVRNVMSQLESAAWLKEHFNYEARVWFQHADEEMKYYEDLIRTVQLAVENENANDIKHTIAIRNSTGDLVSMDKQAVETLAIASNTLANYKTFKQSMEDAKDGKSFLKAYMTKIEEILTQSMVLMAKFDAIVTDKDVCANVYKICMKSAKDEDKKKIVRVCKRSAEDYRILNQPFKLSEVPSYHVIRTGKHHQELPYKH